jgi:hypothetical protein
MVAGTETKKKKEYIHKKEAIKRETNSSHLRS